MLSIFGARDPGVLRPLGVVIASGALLFLVSLPSGAQDAKDVCVLNDTDMQTEVGKGAAEIAKAYAGTTSQLSLNGEASGGDPVENACNWTCGGGRIPTAFTRAFGFLQYNCSSTMAPPSTRLPTGSGRKSQSQMGLSITDAEYHALTDKIFRSGSTGEGDLMRVPSWLKDASQDGDVKKLTRAIEANPGTAWMKFSSTSVNNDGQGFDRIIIRVPDTQTAPRFEQWIQIAINRSTGKLGRNVDFLAVQLSPDPTSPLSDGHPMVAFRGYSRIGFVAEGPGGGSSLSKCYACHQSGLRAIIPAPSGASLPDGTVALKPEGTIPLTGPGNITEITNEQTKRLSVFGPTGYTASQNGPPLGPSTWFERDEFVAKGCARSLPPPRQQAIVRNMDCQACHDSETDRGILNAGSNLQTVRHKVVENTVAPMPPKEKWEQDLSLKLSPDERNVLFQCLKAEYAELLQEWLTADLRFLGPPTWVSLGGGATSGPAVALTASGGLVVFVRGADDAIWYTSQAISGSDWSPWQSLGGIATGSPAAARSQDRGLDVFVRGTDQAIWTRRQTPADGQWSQWTSLGGGAISGPAVALTASGGLVVFVRGTDDAIWYTSQALAGGDWSPWQSLGGVATGSPAAARSHDGRLYVFVRGADQAVWTRREATPDGQWSKWTSLGGGATSDPAAALTASGGLVVFVRGTDNALYQTSQAQRGGDWSPWQSLGGVATSSPAAALSQDRRLHVFVRGTDNAIWDGGM